MKIKFLFLIFILVALIGCKPEIKDRDYCAKDSDCVVKKRDCDCCGYMYGCVTEETPEFECEREGFPCACIHEKPRSCVCVDNECHALE